MTISFHREAPPIHDVDGVLRIGDTGVTLETVLWAFQEGSTPEDIVDQFPGLQLGDVYEVVAYYLRHREDIDPYLTDREGAYRRTSQDLRQLIGERRHARLHRTQRQ